MKAMFQECNELEYLDLSNFDTSKVNDMEYMFYECKKLKEIKGINKFNTNNVINMRGMFQFCNELEYLDLSNFDTSKVNNMAFMFNECKKLKELNLENFKINNNCKLENIFMSISNKCKFIGKDQKLNNYYNSLCFIF